MSPKVPEQITRLSIVVALFLGVILFVRHSIIPAHLKETGFHRESTIQRETSRKVKYVGSTACKECHGEVYDMKRSGYHRGLSCETCHGPGRGHMEDPETVRLLMPTRREACQLCHAYQASRPTGFPQINPVVHNPLKACSACHDPHEPQPKETPRECGACHGEIAKTKSVSHHALLECTTCHRTPEKHKNTPRVIRPTKPYNREFCGKCHGRDSKRKDTPKVDLSIHGEKYLCWQCHYPHMPEAR